MNLSEHTTLRVGGPADGWVVAESDDELVQSVRECDDTKTPVLLLGDGSNMVVADEGFRGSVVEVASRGRLLSRLADSVKVKVFAGEPWDELVELAVAEGWSGIEALSGIPGRCGAAPFQNIGAYGQDVSSTLVDVDVLDRHTGELSRLSSAECEFGYRTSVFKRQTDRWVIRSLTLALRQQSAGIVGYADLAGALGVKVGASAPLADIRAAVLELRRAKGMVLDDDDHDTWSAGSFFTNPVVGSQDQAPDGCPRYSAAAGVKLSAAWLIEQSGIPRGFALAPSAAISSKHTLALTNRGNATCADVLALARVVQDRVAARFDIDLDIEPTLVGARP
jgi:UDP-N-acetylmuramate dehydrogenase